MNFKNIIIVFVLLGILPVSFAKEDHQRKLKDLGIRSINVPIHDQSAERLTEEFQDEYAKSRDNPVNISLMMRNIIWQQYEARHYKQSNEFIEVMTGRNPQKPKFKGNIRSFWYAYIKTPLDNLGIVKDEHYQLLSEVFSNMVEDGLLRYQDIGFTDETKHSRILGKLDNVIVFAEKTGSFSFLEELNRKYEVTVICLGGQSSLLTAEFFTDQIKKAGTNVKQKFHVFSIVDYDPSGWIIRDGFLKHLAVYGIKTVEVIDLVTPDLLSPELLKIRSVTLPDHPLMKKKNENWLQESGGINGELLGLEVEALNPDDIDRKFYDYVLPIMNESYKKHNKEAA